LVERYALRKDVPVGLKCCSICRQFLLSAQIVVASKVKGNIKKRSKIMSLRRKLLYGKPKPPFLPKSAHHKIGEKTIQLNEVSLHGWLAQPKGVTTGAVLYFNGRRESPTTIFRFLDVLEGQAVAVFYHRGLGPSTGKPSEAALVSDGIQALDWLSERTQLPTSSIVIIGRSLGSGVAVQVASICEIAGLILISPFDSLVNVVRKRFGVFPDFLLQDKFNSAAHISKVRCPILSITGARDKTIPIEMSVALFDQWDGHLYKHAVPEGRHRGLLRYASVQIAMASFLSVALRNGR
jgi:pimeloyl-ACP methyl ester carboxylesterase